MFQRLDKLIASQGTLSRSETVRLIRKGLVRVNDVICRDPALKVDGERVKVTVDGVELCYQQFVYIMMNKPSGILCVSRDPRVKTVVDLLPDELRRKGLFPAGRLDKTSVGLVLLTDDGEYAHRILSPKNDVEKCYHVRLDGPVSEEDILAFKAGITLADGTLCKAASLCVLEQGDAPLVEVKITEGRYHQIKRMFGVRGLGVDWLKRISVGKLCLDETLAEGESRYLSVEERSYPFI